MGHWRELIAFWLMFLAGLCCGVATERDLKRDLNVKRDVKKGERR
jgi:hypothetical protein